MMPVADAASAICHLWKRQSVSVQDGASNKQKFPKGCAPATLDPSGCEGSVPASYLILFKELWMGWGRRSLACLDIASSSLAFYSLTTF